MMPLNDLLQNRRSTRRFRPDAPIDRAELNALISQANRAPSSNNAQPWRIMVLTDPALRQRSKAMRQEMSEAEAKLWQHLRAGRLNGYKFRRQQPMGNYIVDFMCVTPKLIVEADGGQHTEQAAYDHARTAYLNSLGFTVLRFWNHEILQQTNDVLAEILRVLQELEKQSAR
ncbi:DUF559 domain-containing protein [uncultured Leptotrichia sp.]|uniref:DUF559 domain-containing protein n=1 Tax=uncultured Leptotrichia sp. TaxID=159271 RepID=UPI00261C49F3|nr:DUF559 domain-containing protein [uncultured Leptotrichia sp.]